MEKETVVFSGEFLASLHVMENYKKEKNDELRIKRNRYLDSLFRMINKYGFNMYSEWETYYDMESKTDYRKLTVDHWLINGTLSRVQWEFPLPRGRIKHFYFDEMRRRTRDIVPRRFKNMFDEII